jgi:hypothetical protein
MATFAKKGLTVWAPIRAAYYFWGHIWGHAEELSSFTSNKNNQLGHLFDAGSGTSMAFLKQIA